MLGQNGLEVPVRLALADLLVAAGGAQRFHARLAEALQAIAGRS
ncbi:hypothetical protein ACO229_06505 [Promicromonospora sp. MS192]